MGLGVKLDGVLPLDLLSERQRAVFAWYSEIAARKGQLPARVDFDPIDFPAVLSHLVLVDVEPSPRRFRVRLVGTAVVDANGRDGTGDYYDEIAGTAVAVDRANRAVADRKPSFEAGVPMTWSPKNFKLYSILSLPLSSEGEYVDMLMYCLEFE